MSRGRHLSGSARIPSNQPHNQNQQDAVAGIWRTLNATWQGVNAFMTHRAEPDLQSTDDSQPYSYRFQSGYGCQVRLYAYLPLVEEQHDWLEEIYRRS